MLGRRTQCIYNHSSATQHHNMGCWCPSCLLNCSCEISKAVERNPYSCSFWFLVQRIFRLTVLLGICNFIPKNTNYLLLRFPKCYISSSLGFKHADFSSYFIAYAKSDLAFYVSRFESNGTKVNFYCYYYYIFRAVLSYSRFGRKYKDHIIHCYSSC